MDEKLQNNEEEVIITLTLENGDKIECTVIAMFDCDDQKYVALLFPADESSDEEVEICLYKCNASENDEFNIENIETDEEFEKVNAVFDSLMAEQQ